MPSYKSTMATDLLQREPLISKLPRINTRILVLCIHSMVSLSIILSLLTMMALILFSEERFLAYTFITESFRNIHYFFSVWVSGMQIMSFMMYSVVDVIDFNKKLSTKFFKMRQILHDFANLILFSINFPLSIVVAILFWGFYLWNRELIYPQIMDELVPPFLNHMMHTTPILLSLLYMFTDVQSEPPKSKTLTILIAFIVLYSSVFLDKCTRRDRWIYPVLEALSPLQVTSVLLFTLTSSFFFYFVGYHLYSKIKDTRSYINEELKRIINANKSRVS